jgi:hypothetical protein
MVAVLESKDILNPREEGQAETEVCEDRWFSFAYKLIIIGSRSL